MTNSQELASKFLDAHRAADAIASELGPALLSDYRMPVGTIVRNPSNKYWHRGRMYEVESISIQRSHDNVLVNVWARALAPDGGRLECVYGFCLQELEPFEAKAIAA